MRGTALALVVAVSLPSCWRGSSGTPEPQATAPSSPPRAAQAPADPRAPLKRREILAMLQRGPVLVHLDARRPGVALPPKHLGEYDLVLRIGYDLEPAVPDLLVGIDMISATLTFDKRPFHVVVPWSAVFAAIVENEPDSAGVIWNEDLPTEMLDASHTP
jgi:stringent starvation protein B